MALSVVGQMQVPGVKWEGMNRSRASLCYTNTKKMLIQLSLSYTLLITMAFVNICLMVLYLCDSFGSSSEKHFLLELPMIIIFIGVAYKNMDPHVGFWCTQIQAVINALKYE